MAVRRFVSSDVWCGHCKKRACKKGEEIRPFDRTHIANLSTESPVNVYLSGQLFDLVKCKHCKKLNWLRGLVEQEQVGTRANPGPHICPCGCGTLVVPEAPRVKEKRR